MMDENTTDMPATDPQRAAASKHGRSTLAAGAIELLTLRLTTGWLRSRYRQHFEPCSQKPATPSMPPPRSTCASSEPRPPSLIPPWLSSRRALQLESG